VAKQDEFTKLFKYMQTEFKQVNDRLDKTASQETVDRVILHMQKEFKQVNDRFDGLEARMDDRFERVEGALDSMIKDVDDKVSNVSALEAQVDRHERYFDKISGVLEVDLDSTKA
jgi:tetrahydromethanopterin S-methyltransferase subunit G